MAESGEKRAKWAAEEAKAQEAALRRFKQMVKDYSHAHLAAHVARTSIPTGSACSACSAKQSSAR